MPSFDSWGNALDDYEYNDEFIEDEPDPEYYPPEAKPVERTLVLLKPDAFERNLVGEIMTILDAKHLPLIGSKLLRMDEPTVQKHYKNHVGKNFFPQLVDFMTSGPSLALVYEGPSACAAMRQLIGEKHPTNSPPGSIRGRFATEYPRNLIHGSDDHHEAEQEIKLYFSEADLFGHKYKANFEAMQAAKTKKAIEDKKKILATPLTPGMMIPYPEQVKKGMVLVSTYAGIAYKVLDVKKKGGKVDITLCRTDFVDNPAAVEMYKVTTTYTNPADWQVDHWSVLTV